MRSRPRHDEIVLLRLNRQEAKIGAASDRIQSHSPVRATLRNRGSHRVVIPRLERIPGWLCSIQKPVDERACPASLVAVDHDAAGIIDDFSDGVMRRASFETFVSAAVDHSLQTAVTRNKLELGRHKPVSYTH